MHRTIKPGKNDMFIIAFDPSIRGWGWVVFNQAGLIIEGNAIRTESKSKAKKIRKGDDNVRRVSEIDTALKRVFKKYKIHHIVSELPHGSQNSMAAMTQGVNLGVIQTIGTFLDIGIDWYSEADAKKSVTDRKQITKDDMVIIIDELYPSYHPRGTKWIDQATADAVAVYHVACTQSPTIQFLRTLKL